LIASTEGTRIGGSRLSGSGLVRLRMPETVIAKARTMMAGTIALINFISGRGARSGREEGVFFHGSRDYASRVSADDGFVMRVFI